ncbi:MAG: hypothetical protein MZV64_64460 [Ignavibacteriales bacterium]|nr:hypothetical protein [Ignavibacteriales bacterium]
MIAAPDPGDRADLAQQEQGGRGAAVRRAATTPGIELRRASCCAKGFKVAICEQMEDPRAGQGHRARARSPTS